MDSQIVIGAFRRRRVSASDALILIDVFHREISRGGAFVRLPPTPFRLAAVLIAAGGRVDHAVLIEALFGDQADGGPLWAVNAISVNLVTVRPALARLGITIEVVPHLGFLAILRSSRRTTPASAMRAAA